MHEAQPLSLFFSLLFSESSKSRTDCMKAKGRVVLRRFAVSPPSYKSERNVRKKRNQVTCKRLQLFMWLEVLIPFFSRWTFLFETQMWFVK